MIRWAAHGRFLSEAKRKLPRATRVDMLDHSSPCEAEQIASETPRHGKRRCCSSTAIPAHVLVCERAQAWFGGGVLGASCSQRVYPRFVFVVS